MRDTAKTGSERSTDVRRVEPMAGGTEAAWSFGRPAALALLALATLACTGCNALVDVDGIEVVDDVDATATADAADVSIDATTGGDADGGVDGTLDVSTVDVPDTAMDADATTDTGTDTDTDVPDTGDVDPCPSRTLIADGSTWTLVEGATGSLTATVSPALATPSEWRARLVSPPDWFTATASVDSATQVTVTVVDPLSHDLWPTDSSLAFVLERTDGSCGVTATVPLTVANALRAVPVAGLRAGFDAGAFDETTGTFYLLDTGTQPSVASVDLAASFGLLEGVVPDIAEIPDIDPDAFGADGGAVVVLERPGTPPQVGHFVPVSGGGAIQRESDLFAPPGDGRASAAASQGGALVATASGNGAAWRPGVPAWSVFNGGNLAPWIGPDGWLWIDRSSVSPTLQRLDLSGNPVSDEGLSCTVPDGVTSVAVAGTRVAFVVGSSDMWSLETRTANPSEAMCADREVVQLSDAGTNPGLAAATPAGLALVTLGLDGENLTLGLFDITGPGPAVAIGEPFAVATGTPKALVAGDRHVLVVPEADSELPVFVEL